MAKAWIEDRWLTKTATPVERRRLNSARDPKTARVAPEHRKSTYGSGARYIVYWMERLPNGALKRRNRRFDRKDDAEAWRTQMEDDLRSGRYVDKISGMHTVAQAADLWKATLPYRVRESSVIVYLGQYERHIAPVWGDAQVASIDPRDVERWVYDMREHGGVRGPLSLRTTQCILATFAAILDQAVERKWLLENPARRLKAMKRPRRGNPQSPARRIYLTVAQIDALARACDELGESDPRARPMAGDGALVLFLAYTGARIGEAAALRVGDVDLDRGTVLIDKTRTRGSDGRHWAKEGPTKNGRSRELPLPGFLLDRLRPLVKDRSADSYVFVNRDGQRLCYEAWRRHRWIPACRKALPDLFATGRLTPHSLRHSYASMLIASGADVKSVQTMMGHSTATMTLDTYADIWPGHMKRAAEALEHLHDAMENGVL